jgi:hypothetical protein
MELQWSRIQDETADPISRFFFSQALPHRFFAIAMPAGGNCAHCISRIWIQAVKDWLSRH